ncbi:VHS1065 protein [Vibrio phage 1]|nr:VHS1065 protein [Vibrio phage 1]
MATANFSTFFMVHAEQKAFNFESHYYVLDSKTFNFASSFDVVAVNTFKFETNFNARDPKTKRAEFISGFLVTDPFKLPVTAYSIKIVIKSQEIDFDSLTDTLNISSNTSGAGYTCSFTSDQIPEGLKLDDPVVITLNGEAYHFVFDRLETEENGLDSKKKTLHAVSPVLRKGSPRAIAIDFTNETPKLASELVRELLGSVTWEIVDWVIPEFRLAVTQQTPLEIARAIVGAAGGTITGTKDGKAKVIYEFPISTNDYPTATPKHILNTFDHVLSMRKNLIPKSGFNSFIVTDVAPGSLGTQFYDVLDYDITTRNSATITAYLSPVRDVTLDETAPEKVTIETLGEKVELTQTEDIEIKNGEGIARRPISSITYIDFISVSLMGVAYAKGSSTLTTSDPEAFGIVRLTYKTIANQYKVSNVKSPKVQFLLKEV